MVNEPLMIVVLEIDLKDGCKHLRYIRFPLDDGKYPICYRSRVSYSAFTHVTKERNYYPNKKKAEILYHCTHQNENIKTLKFLGLDPNVATIDVQNVWEFYKLIGYNHKTKKWNR